MLDKDNYPMEGSMTGQWRPEGWIDRISFEELSHIKPSLVSMMTEKEIKIFEAGADAMLKALKQKGHHEALIATDRVGISYNPLTGRYVQTGDEGLGRGIWVFVPEG